MAKEKKEKAPKPKKEKKEKKPKVKKEKPPKPKKEKKPKVKKEKPPRPKKEKKVKARTKAAADGGGTGGEEEEEKKGFGKKKLLLILLPVVVAVAATAVFLIPQVLGTIGGDREADGDAPSEAGETAPPEDGEPEESAPPAGDGETEGDTSQSGAAGGAVSGSGEVHTGMTTAQVVGYVEGLSPAVLGLEGTDMSEYEVYASDSVVLIDGRVCTQVRVYDDSSVGTNEIKGIFFLSRDSARILYRYDSDTDSVYQMEVGSARYDESSGTVTLTEAES